MNALKAFNTVALPKLSSSDPAMKRHAKLLAQSAAADGIKKIPASLR